MKNISKTQFRVALENSYKFLNNQVKDYEDHELLGIFNKVKELRNTYITAIDARTKSEAPLAQTTKVLSIQRRKMERTIRSIWREVKYLNEDYPLLGYKTYIVPEGDSALIKGSWSRPATRNRALQLAKGLDQIKVDGHPLPLGVGPEIIHHMVEEFDEFTQAYMAAYENRATKRSQEAALRRNSSKIFTLLRSNLKVYFQDLPEHLIQERIRMTGLVAVAPVASRRNQGENPPSTGESDGSDGTSDQEGNDPQTNDATNGPNQGQSGTSNSNGSINSETTTDLPTGGDDSPAEPASAAISNASGGAL